MEGMLYTNRTCIFQKKVLSEKVGLKVIWLWLLNLFQSHVQTYGGIFQRNASSKEVGLFNLRII